MVFQCHDIHIAAVNTVFGTELTAEEFGQVMGDIRSTSIDASDWTDTAVKNNLDLVRWAQDAADNGWGYVYGTYGTVLDEELLASKITQYPNEVGSDETFIRQNWLEKRTADCVGLIKGYGWYDAENQQTVIDTEKMPDISADTMYENASEKGTIDTIPEIPGLAVWHEGHIGIYIGNGEVVQAANTTAGVIRNKLEDTAWTHWLKVPYIEYRENTEKKQVKNTGGIGNGTTIYRSYAEGSRRQWEAVYGLEIRQGCNGMMAERRKKSTVGRGTTNLFDELCPK